MYSRSGCRPRRLAALASTLSGRVSRLSMTACFDIDAVLFARPIAEPMIAATVKAFLAAIQNTAPATPTQPVASSATAAATSDAMETESGSGAEGDEKRAA